MPEELTQHEGGDFVAPDENERVQDSAAAEEIARASNFHRDLASTARTEAKRIRSTESSLEAEETAKNLEQTASTNDQVVEHIEKHS